jgi:putative transposase
MTTEHSMTLNEYLRQVGVDPNGDFLREGARLLAQMAMELEVSQQIGAAKYQRSAERTTQRNGYRERDWDTRVGTVALQIPKLRQGSYFPSLLEPRRRAERALLSVVQQAYIAGVSTRKVDELVQALGLDGIDKSRVSRTCQELDELVQGFRTRPLEHSYPYIWLDAVYLKVRINHRIVSQAAVVAIGVRETGEREVLGLALGAGESEPFWVEFLRSLVARGLQGVQLVTSDSHAGLKAALSKVLSGASWQRCRAHFTLAPRCARRSAGVRNLLAHIPNGEKTMVAALVRTIFVQPHRQAAGQQVSETLRLMQERWPQAAAVLAEAENDVLAYMSFPVEHWSRIYSTNPLERLNREIRRRTDVVGVFPDQQATLRLVGAVLIEQNDEWEDDKRYFSQESMRKVLAPEAMALPPKEGHLPRLAPVR